MLPGPEGGQPQLTLPPEHGRDFVVDDTHLCERVQGDAVGMHDRMSRASAAHLTCGNRRPRHMPGFFSSGKAARALAFGAVGVYMKLLPLHAKRITRRHALERACARKNSTTRAGRRKAGRAPRWSRAHFENQARAIVSGTANRLRRRLCKHLCRLGHGHEHRHGHAQDNGTGTVTDTVMDMVTDKRKDMVTDTGTDMVMDTVTDMVTDTVMGTYRTQSQTWSRTQSRTRARTWHWTRSWTLLALMAKRFSGYVLSTH